MTRTVFKIPVPNFDSGGSAVGIKQNVECGACAFEEYVTDHSSCSVCLKKRNMPLFDAWTGRFETNWCYTAFYRGESPFHVPESAYIAQCVLIKVVNLCTNNGSNK